MSDGIHRFLPNDEYQAAVGANNPSTANVYATIADIVGGSSPIVTGNTLWVDAVNGNDGTALPDRQDLQYLTIGAAITASSPGDLISVRPGTYPETATLDITGLSLISTGGWENTTIGDGSVTAYDVIQIGAEGYLQGFSILVPNSVQAAVECNQVSGTNSVYDVAFYGTGTTGPGTGINRTGGGKTIGSNIRVEGGGMANALRVDSGVLALEGIHVPNSPGAIDNVLLVTVDVGPTTGGRAQMFGFNTGSPNVTNAIRTEGGAIGLTDNPTALIFTPNIFNCTNALSTDGVYQTSNLLGGRIENVTYAVAVDFGATGVGLESSIYRISANHQPKYFYNPEVAGKSEFTLAYIQEPTTEFDSSYNIFGFEQISVGIAEKGTESSFGKGAPYTTGMVVLNATNLQIPNIANNITDITPDAISKDGSSFGFQTTATNNGIYIGSLRRDVNGDPLPFYGFQLSTIIAAVGSVGDYIIETWDGTGWRAVNAMSTSLIEGYPYSINHFLRADSEEFVRAGITNDSFYQPNGFYEVLENTNWQPVSVTPTAGPLSGVAINSYWLRIKTTTPGTGGTTYPTFEQFKITDSAFNISKNGIPSGIGLGMFRKTIFLSGRVWSGSLTGGMNPTIDLGNYAETVGNTTGNNWTHEINYSVIEEGDSLSVQFPIPIGTCTAFPLKIKCAVEFQSGGMAVDLNSDPITLTAQALPQAVSGNFIADPAGGKTLVKREFSSADLLSAAGSRDPNNTPVLINGSSDVISGAIGATTWSSINNMLHEIELCEVDVSSLYENDIIVFNIDYTTDVSGDNLIVPFSLIIEGVFHQDGAGI